MRADKKQTAIRKRFINECIQCGMSTRAIQAAVKKKFPFGVSTATITRLRAKKLVAEKQNSKVLVPTKTMSAVHWQLPAILQQLVMVMKTEGVAAIAVSDDGAFELRRTEKGRVS